MTEEPKKLCDGCKWNKYPECIGSIMLDGSWMNIENLTSAFSCGVKDSLTVIDHRPQISTIIEDLESRIEVLEEKVNALEEVRK